MFVLVGVIFRIYPGAHRCFFGNVLFLSLYKVEEGKYYLEDHTAQVPLNFSQASLLTDGFITENSIVLVEGEAIDGVLHVHKLGKREEEDV